MSDIVIPASHAEPIISALKVIRASLDEPSVHFSVAIQKVAQAEIDAALPALNPFAALRGTTVNVPLVARSPRRDRSSDMPKERPILFSSEMVRALLDGRKCQTRRVIKPQPTVNLDWVTEWGWTFFTPDKHISGRVKNPAIEPREIFLPCPYVLGQRLWVRETWRKGMTDSGLAVEYAADGHRVYLDDYPDKSVDWYWLPDMPNKPSIFMPRWASRITLEVVSVRVERVQSISTADACVEGILGCRDHLSNVHAISTFKALWNSINAARGYSWESNPFVWTITFRRLSQPP